MKRHSRITGKMFVSECVTMTIVATERNVDLSDTCLVEFVNGRNRLNRFKMVNTSNI